MNHTQSLYFLLFNVFMMGWNVFLSVVPIVFARLLQKTKSRNAQIVLFPLWLIFVPNTLYMITDVIHIFNPRFSQMSLPFQILGMGLYLLIFFLAVYTFVLAIKPVLQKYHAFLTSLNSRYKIMLFAFFSGLIGFAISMGRFQRTNTWYIFTQPIRVVRDVIDSLTDPTVLFVALFYAIGAFVLIKIIDSH
jgi:uncharacterized membrane protein